MADAPQLPSHDEELDDEPTAEEIETWPTALAVAAQLGKTARWVRAQVRAGTFHPKLDSAEHMRFDPLEVEALMPQAGMVAIQNQDGMFRVLSEHARMLASSNEALLRVLPQNLKGLVEGQNELNRQLAERVKRLEEERTHMLEAAEDAQTKREERRLERMKAKRTQKRLDDALKNFTELSSKFLDQWLIGKDMKALLASLDPALLDGLLAEDMPLLSAEQKAQLRNIWERMQEAKRKANGKAQPLELGDGKPKPETPPAAATPAKPEVVA